MSNRIIVPPITVKIKTEVTETNPMLVPVLNAIVLKSIYQESNWQDEIMRPGCLVYETSINNNSSVTNAALVVRLGSSLGHTTTLFIYIDRVEIISSDRDTSHKWADYLAARMDAFIATQVEEGKLNG